MPKVEVTLRGVRKSQALEERIAWLLEHRLAPVCTHINRCEVAIERPNERVTSGSGYRVRLNLTVAPSHSVVVSREPHQGTIRDNLLAVVQSAFEAARRQLQKLSAQQRGSVKSHEQQQVTAIVSRLFADHGFLETTDGREVYFHRNSVLGHGSNGIRVGAGVAFSEELGERGPQARSVRVLDSRGMES